MKTECSLKGFAIVVLERGFVYVGHAEVTDEWVVIHEAQNIRIWGTTKGLGQLALEGPTDKTRLDAAGIVRAPRSALIHLLETEQAKWKC